MNKYSKDDIEKIINECEILFLPENASIEDVLTKGNCSGSSSENGDFVSTNRDEAEEDFEDIYQKAKESKRTLDIPPPTDFSYLCPPVDSGSTSTTAPDPVRMLIINKTCRDRLLNLRLRVLALIKKVDAQYNKNNIFLDSANCDSNDEATFKLSYIKCGAPFFKNALGEPAPFNEDYKYRKYVAKEFFPFDLPSTSSRWTTGDKVALVMGVKKQMVDHIKSQQSRKLCQERKTRNTMQKMRFIAHNQDLDNSAIIDIYKTIQIDFPNFAINWNLISFDSLQSNHSVSECMGMWLSYLRPDLNRDPFSQEENETLKRLACDEDFNSWSDVASQLNQRSLLQTFVHYQSAFPRIYPAKVRWTQEEDDELLKAVEAYSINGITNWHKIGQIIPTRSKTQCYNRHQIIVKSAATKKGVFNQHENRAILEFVSQFGENAFTKMPTDFLPGRSVVQIKNHYRAGLQHRGKIHPWTREEDKTLMDFVEQNGTDWATIADVLKTHNRISCRTRYVIITKFLKKNPGSTVADVPIKHRKLTAFHKVNVEESEDDDQVSDKSKLAITKFKREFADMFQLLRQTFNFDFGAREISVDNTKLQVLMKMFGIKNYEIPERQSHRFTASQLIKFRELVNSKMNQTFLKELKFVTDRTQFLMPPNYNTIVGLRYIAIKKHEEPIEADKVAVVKPGNQKYDQALLNFQKLYVSLFYWSAMLTNIPVSEINNIHFMKCQLGRGNLPSDVMRQFTKRKFPVSATDPVQCSSSKKAKSK